ncbi:MAG: hypothetical protein K0U34_05175 [Alphaproteobacteria bacterium]|nr:hypothetical protein [Alphaproteobacteria bacterium]
MAHYQHTQRATYLLPLFLVLALLTFILAVAAVDVPAVNRLLYVLSAVLLAAGWLFSSLTVAVTDDQLRWFFGPGFWNKSIARSEITSAQPVRTKWWYGWGIRMTPKGWLYNVSGLDAVAITTKSGKTVLIGSDEPQALAGALKS